MPQRRLIMRTPTGTRFLSIVLSLALLFSSFPAFGIQGESVTPGFVKALTPASHLGFVDSFYQGQTENPVILIQDLHANYGVQKKIYGMLRQLQPKIAHQDKPMIVGVEAA